MATLRDAIYGLAVGDALGVPLEFKSRDTYEVTDMTEFGTHNQPIGTWSDDTSLTLATCYSIKRMNSVNYKDILECFRMWLNESKFTATGLVFDVGMTTARAIRQGYGMKNEYSNGNGSLMRIIPLAFIENIQDREIEKVSAITHAHDISCKACIYYVNIAMALIDGKSIMEAVQESIPDTSSFSNIKHIDKLSREQIKSSGYVVDSFEAAIWCVATTNSFEECALKAVNLGYDTDTVAAIAGALAGIIYGYENIPKRWIDNLKNKALIEDCLFETSATRVLSNDALQPKPVASYAAIHNNDNLVWKKQKIEYFPEDVEKMKNMTDKERIDFKGKLKEMNRYSIIKNTVEKQYCAYK